MTCNEGRARAQPPLRIGVIDTGVNPWHSHVRGAVSGCRIYATPHGTIAEDGDFRDLSGHGTAVAGIIREGLPDAHLFAVRVFDAGHVTYPSLVARAILRAAAEQCAFVNLSLGVPPGPGADAVEAACVAALAAGCVLVASTQPGRAGWLPAAVPGVHVAFADDRLSPGEVEARGTLRFAAAGVPRVLGHVSCGANFSGHSFACARTLVHIVGTSRQDEPGRRFPQRQSAVPPAIANFTHTIPPVSQSD